MPWVNPVAAAYKAALPSSKYNQEVVENSQWLHDNLLAPYFVYLRDEKAAGTHGGTFSSGAWRTRTLNVEVIDSHNICTLSANQFTLPAGDYYIWASAPAHIVDNHKIKLYNVTDGADVMIGTSERCWVSDGTQTRSVLQGRFTIAAQKTFELQHRSTGSRSNDGFGFATNVGVVEVYAEVWLRKESF